MKPKSRKFPSLFLYYFSIAFLMTAFFELWRLLTLLQLRNSAAGIPKLIVAQSFLVGLRFDFSIACYVTLPIALLGMLPFIDVGRVRFLRWLNTGLLFILAALVFFVSLADIEYFKFFNSRLNAMALQWTDTSDFVVSMIWQTYPVVKYMLLYSVVLVLFFKAVLYLQRRQLVGMPPTSVWINLISIPILFGLMLLGIRGRLEEKAPLTWGQAYFSEYSFANLLALNPNFTFARDLFIDSGDRDEVAKNMAKIARPDALTLTRNMLNINTSDTSVISQRLYRRINFNPENPNPPNLIVILMESFGSAGIGTLDHQFKYDLSPCFDSLVREGILFTDFYSAGMHTYLGLLGSLYGYPAVPGESQMKQVTGQNQFWGLPSILRGHHYHTMFFCPHDPHFDNMQGFLKANGIEEVYSLFDFDPKEKLSTLGVPDHVMFDHAVDIIKKKGGKPFFAALLSASNHGPWIIPDVPFEHIPDSDELHPQLNAYKYSDWSLGRFIRKIQSDPAFKNTIIMITGDHGTQASVKYDLEISRFTVPLLILDTNNRLPRGVRIDRTGSQIDMLSTAMGLLKLNYDNYSFGRDLLDTKSLAPEESGFALFSEGYTIGFVKDHHYLIWRLGANKSLYGLPGGTTDICPANPNLCDSLDLDATAYYQTAYFNLKYPLNHLQETRSPHP